MFFLITCRDKPNSAAVRNQHRPAHLEWLKTDGAGVRIGGGLLPADGDGGSCGSVLLIEADSLEAARSWAANDPYAKAGLFAEKNLDNIVPMIGTWVPAQR